METSQSSTVGNAHTDNGSVGAFLQALEAKEREDDFEPVVAMNDDTAALLQHARAKPRVTRRRASSHCGEGVAVARAPEVANMQAVKKRQRSDVQGVDRDGEGGQSKRCNAGETPRGKASVLPQPIAGNDLDVPQAGKGNRGDLLDASGASAEPCRSVSDAIHGAAGSDGQNESLMPEEDDATQVGEEVVVPRMTESSQGSNGKPRHRLTTKHSCASVRYS